MPQTASTKAELTAVSDLNRLLLLNLDRYCYTTPELLEAARYAVGSPGHRWRPLLFFEVWKALTHERQLAEHHVSLVTAIEYVHTASIILDDLPAMDDGSLRRGQLPCHLKFGQSRAILTALWLCDVAQSVLHQAQSLHGIQLDLEELFRSVKAEMINGQIWDLERGADATLLQLIEKGRLKSGALYGFTASLPAYLLDRIDAATPLREFGNYLGIAYQISDDVQDCVALKDQIGKDVGKDQNTIPRLFGLQRAQKLKQEYMDKAIVELQKIATPCDSVAALVDQICV